MYNYLNQERIMKKYRMGNHNQKCIDGRITGSGNCVGFCTNKSTDPKLATFREGQGPPLRKHIIAR